jgi:hypothetical protein
VLIGIIVAIAIAALLVTTLQRRKQHMPNRDGKPPWEISKVAATDGWIHCQLRLDRTAALATAPTSARGYFSISTFFDLDTPTRHGTALGRPPSWGSPKPDLRIGTVITW